MRRLSVVAAVVSAAAVVGAGCAFSPPAPLPSSSAVSASLSVTPSSSSSSKKASEPLPDAAALLKESSSATAELTSLHLVFSMTGNFAKIPVKRLAGDVTRQPDTAAKGNARIAFRGSEADVRFVVFGGDLYLAQSGDSWVDHGPASQIYDATTILDPETGLANMLTSFVDPQVEGRETIDDVQTVRITGEVAADALNKIAPQSGAAKRVPCSVWIQETGEHQLVQLKLTPNADDAIQMALSNWNVPVIVGKPRV